MLAGVERTQPSFGVVDPGLDATDLGGDVDQLRVKLAAILADGGDIGLEFLRQFRGALPVRMRAFPRPVKPASAKISKRTRSARVMMGMPALHMSHSQPAHVLGQVSISGRPEQQVPMIGQEAKPQEPHGHDFGSLFQDPLEGRVIARFLENPAPADSSVEHVIDVTASGTAKTAGHDNEDTVRCSDYQ